MFKVIKNLQKRQIRARLRYLINKLAEKRYEYGIAMKKDPEEW
jgi:hypothetical protein